jgi:hypothetical protein
MCLLLFLTIAFSTSCVFSENIELNSTDSIADAVSQINSGSDSDNTIILNSGVYDKSNDVNIVISRSNMNLLIKGNDSANKAVIDAGGLNRIFKIDSNSNTNITFENIVFKNGYTLESDGGGGIFNQNSKLTIQNCQFLNNGAFKGGAIENHANNLFINGSFFIGSGIPSSTFGAGIENYGANLSIWNSAFINNSATFGSAINNHGDDLSLFYCNFTGNSADEGIIRVEGNDSHILIKGCNFNNNTSEKGLVVVAGEGKNNVFEVNDTTFTNNKWVGDLFYTTSNNTIDLHNVTNEDNVVEYTTGLDLQLRIGNDNNIIITALLSNSYTGEVIKNSNVIIYINGVRCWSGNTNDQGIVSYNYAYSSSGDYVVTVEFLGKNITDGEDIYINKAVSNTKSIYATFSNKTFISIKNFKGKYKSYVKLSITLKNANNKPISNKDINFYINNVNIGFTKTNSKGVATLSYKIPKTGSLSVIARFFGGDGYMPSEAKSSLSVPKASYVKITNLKAVRGKSPRILSVLANSGYNKVKTVLRYKLPKGLVYKKPLVSTGKISFNKRTRILTWLIPSLKVNKKRSALLYWKPIATKRGYFAIKPVVSKATGLKVTSNNRIVFRVR